MSQRATHATEVVSTESPHDSDSLETEEEDQESDSEEDEEALQHYSDEEETSPGLVKNFRDSFKKEPQPTTKVTSRPKDTTTSQSPDDEVIGRRSQPLRDILKLHESKVQEPAVAEESPRLKPKQRLRENFETTSEKQESRVHKTWDMQTDLSTRSLNMKNIIAQHETITSDDTPKPKKLTGILKKTSSSNILSIETRSSVTAETTTDSETKEDVTVKQQLNSTDDILDTLTEDQITRLSEEFDLRAQDDGVIKTEEESMEELSGGYQVTSRKEEDHTDGSKFVRKTSYTEIKLQQPSTEEGTRHDDLSDHEHRDHDKRQTTQHDKIDTRRHVSQVISKSSRESSVRKTTSVSGLRVGELSKPPQPTEGKPHKPNDSDPGKKKIAHKLSDDEPEKRKKSPGRPSDEPGTRKKSPGRPSDEPDTRKKSPSRPSDEPETTKKSPTRPGDEPETVRRRPGDEPEIVRRRPGDGPDTRKKSPTRPGDEPESVRRRPGDEPETVKGGQVMDQTQGRRVQLGQVMNQRQSGGGQVMNQRLSEGGQVMNQRSGGGQVMTRHKEEEFN
ncbi:muscle M-line assembly protein unc-89-like [Homarus americanus]|uniref:muscle M-line assembly protein unc-89-like n=1 Tax=Homarus americanus TaxID=6706 RepID=UPI001C46F2F0|nr:muscle M-line assembly protein unc-89-like [Homarus americanus]